MDDRSPRTEGEEPQGRSWRRIFEEELRPLEVDQRVQLARQASGERLRAFCFDPSPRVATAVLDNGHSGLEHARLLARHHRSSTGLDRLGDRPAFLRDRQVQRHLFRNPQLSERLLRRILQPQRMQAVYRLSLSRDTTDRVRRTTRKEFRKKFTAGTAEERVSLILKCEGRCLSQLIGLALDAKAAALLCRRPLNSTLLIRNLTRWPSTPPHVLRHLARQPMVRRSPALRNAILRHPNAPAQLKSELRG